MKNTTSETEKPGARKRPAEDSATVPLASQPSKSPPLISEDMLAGSAAEAPTLTQRITSAVTQGRPRIGIILLAVVGVALIVVALFLPPLSLLERMGLTGYSSLDGKTHQIVHPDGLTVSVDPETFDGRLRVRIESVPRLDFLEGSAGASLRAAVEPSSLPSYLTVKSPYYEITASGETLQPVTIEVLVPNDAEPWQTLDLYSWTGEAWEFVGGELHTETGGQEYLRAVVDQVPTSMVVMQAGAVAPSVATYVEPGDELVAAVAALVDEVNPTGLLLGTMGGFAGELVDPGPPGEGGAVVPALRNWAPGAEPNRGLLYDLLAMPKVQEGHIAGITQSCVENGFAGAEIDYRGVLPEERDAYTAFIRALAKSMHESGLRLSVVLTPIEAAGGGWDEGSYDWAAIGAAADVVRVPFPVDPSAYAAGGRAEQLLDWVTARVSRYKARMVVSSLSAEQTGDEIAAVSLEEALAPFGQATSLQDLADAETGDELSFGLSGSLLSISPVEASGTYRLEYEDKNGGTRTIWLGTPDNLAAKLRLALNYHLGGFVVSDLLKPGNASGVVAAVAELRSTGSVPPSDPVRVEWTVTGAGTTVDATSTPLTEPTYSWMVLANDGAYDVSAAIAGFDHGTVSVQIGAAAADVATDTIVTRPTTTVTTTTEVTPTEETDVVTPTEETVDCLDSAYVADVSIPDNTQLDQGEEFEKAWRVRNSGTCAWPADTVIAFASGTQMDAEASVAVGALEAGEQIDVSVAMKAPDEDGRYTGTWRLSAGGNGFGTNLTIVIQIGEPVAGPITPVSGGSFELGGHVRDMGMPHADRMHYSGMNWAKVQVHFGQDVSGLVAAAHSRGFKIQLSALGSPGMVTEGGFEANFASWVASMAATGADAIEVWNEPNIDREWQIGHISPEAYTRLLCASYAAIKGANPGTAVISAAPAPTGYFGGCGPNGCDDAPWMAGLRNAGAANCMDYIGAHHNSGATSPSASSGHPADGGGGHHSWYFLPQTRLYYNTFGGARKLFYTEMGYASQEGVPTFSDQFAWARGTNNAQQAAWLAEAVSLSVNTGMVRCIIVWNIDFVRYGYDPQDGYAIIRPGGGCPACDTLHAVLGTR
jgi:hypothetical protein